MWMCLPVHRKHRVLLDRSYHLYMSDSINKQRGRHMSPKQQLPVSFLMRTSSCIHRPQHSQHNTRNKHFYHSITHVTMATNINSVLCLCCPQTSSRSWTCLQWRSTTLMPARGRRPARRPVPCARFPVYANSNMPTASQGWCLSMGWTHRTKTNLGRYVTIITSAYAF